MIRRIASLFLLAGLLVPLAVSPVAAQDDAEPAAIVATDGSPLADFFVPNVIDPFETWSPDDPPFPGYHYVAFELYLDNTGSQPFEVRPDDFVLLDTDGFLYAPGSVRQLEGSEIPELERGPVEPRSSRAGLIVFEARNEATIAELMLFGAEGLAATIATFGEAEAPALGDPVEAIGPDGGPALTVTATDLSDPFTDFQEGSEPQRGSRFLLLSVAIDNVSPRPFQVNPQDLLLQDSDGYVWGPSQVYRADETEPELEYGDLAAGDSSAGVVGYEIPEAIEVQRLLYRFGNGRLLVLATLSASPSGDVPPEESPAASGGEADCEVAAEWLEAASRENDALTQIVGTLMVMRTEEDPTYAETAHQVVEAMMGYAGALEGFTTLPDELAELNGELIDAVVAYATALDDVATAVEAGDADAETAASQALYDSEPELITAIQEVSELAEGCGVAP
jgi:hypothetical protein